MSTILCPNGVTHSVSNNDEDFIEFVVDGEWVDYFTNQELEPYSEEWEIEEFAEDEEHADYMRKQRHFYLPCLMSIVDNSKPMDVYEVAKCFNVDYFLTKGWVRFIDGVNEDSSFD